MHAALANRWPAQLRSCPTCHHQYIVDVYHNGTITANQGSPVTQHCNTLAQNSRPTRQFPTSSPDGSHNHARVLTASHHNELPTHAACQTRDSIQKTINKTRLEKPALARPQDVSEVALLWKNASAADLKGTWYSPQQLTVTQSAPPKQGSHAPNGGLRELDTGGLLPFQPLTPVITTIPGLCLHVVPLPQ